MGVDEEKVMREAAERAINCVGTPLDVTYAVLFLASDLSSWVRGTNIVVDG